jgi:hypothetical protein
MLNPLLYNKLQELYGEVRITNENIKAPIRMRKDSSGKTFVEVDSGGEEYSVCCPFCGDERFRLYISHRYATRVKTSKGEASTGSGLAWCHNETHCMEDFAKRKALYDAIQRGGFSNKEFFSHDTAAKPSARFRPPDNLIAIDQLLKSHVCRKYLQSRDVSIDVARELNFTFCAADKEFPLATGRLFIPVYNTEGELCGGQCKAVTDIPDYLPSYYSMPGSKFSITFFNYHRAIKYPRVIVTEGVFDALSVDGGVACLGGSISKKQEILINTHWEEAIVVPDMDVPGSLGYIDDIDKRLERLMNKLDQWKIPVEVCLLPEGEDPSSVGREKIQEFLSDSVSVDEARDYFKSYILKHKIRLENKIDRTVSKSTGNR